MSRQLRDLVLMLVTISLGACAGATRYPAEDVALAPSIDTSSSWDTHSWGISDLRSDPGDAPSRETPPLDGLLLDGISLDTQYAAPTCGWTDGVDHQNKDWVLKTGQVLTGRHRGIGTLTVPAGVNVFVKPYDGAHGSMELCARVIVVQGTISATAAGYGSGGGGGGGAAGGGGGPYNGAPGGGGAGIADGKSGGGGDKPQVNQDCGHSSGGGGRGGGGGKGGGPFGGAGGPGGQGGVTRYAKGSPGGRGANGGYAGPAKNGDTSQDISLHLGSGGGGGGGGGGGSHFGNGDNFGGGGGGGGGAGGRGGGIIKLFADTSITISGSLLARGAHTGGNGDAGHNGACRFFGGAGGKGGTAVSKGSSAGGKGGTPCLDGGNNRFGGKGGPGGAGAGGGILVRAPKVTITGTLDARGGASTNGGTVKIFYRNTKPGGTVRAGRTLVLAY